MGCISLLGELSQCRWHNPGAATELFRQHLPDHLYCRRHTSGWSAYFQHSCVIDVVLTYMRLYRFNQSQNLPGVHTVHRCNQPCNHAIYLRPILHPTQRRVLTQQICYRLVWFLMVYYPRHLHIRHYYNPTANFGL